MVSASELSLSSRLAARATSTRLTRPITMPATKITPATIQSVTLRFRLTTGWLTAPQIQVTVLFLPNYRGCPMLRLVLPKGSLERQTLELFEAADLQVTRSSSVSYQASIDDPRVEGVAILRPQEIPRYVAEGRFDLGVTGRDWIEETSSEVVSLGELHYSKATGRPVRIVLAVQADSPARSVADLSEGVRGSTEYVELTRRFFEKSGIQADIQLSYGATEAKTALGIADAVVELT